MYILANDPGGGGGSKEDAGFGIMACLEVTGEGG